MCCSLGNALLIMDDLAWCVASPVIIGNGKDIPFTAFMWVSPGAIALSNPCHTSYSIKSAIQGWH